MNLKLIFLTQYQIRRTYFFKQQFQFLRVPKVLKRDSFWCKNEPFTQLNSFTVIMLFITFWDTQQIFGKSKGQYCSVPPLLWGLIKSSISQGCKHSFLYSMWPVMYDAFALSAAISLLKYYAIKISWFFWMSFTAQWGQIYSSFNSLYFFIYFYDSFN